ncbi:hypothetical protein B0H12DRAFT_1307630 [Mycena haematopus]|nr:hypothetical protein B0H12DRAFT_1307630 [Mycena haematopus]
MHSTAESSIRCSVKLICAIRIQKLIGWSRLDKSLFNYWHLRSYDSTLLSSTVRKDHKRNFAWGGRHWTKSPFELRGSEAFSNSAIFDKIGLSPSHEGDSTRDSKMRGREANSKFPHNIGASGTVHNLNNHVQKFSLAIEGRFDQRSRGWSKSGFQGAADPTSAPELHSYAATGLRPSPELRHRVLCLAAIVLAEGETWRDHSVSEHRPSFAPYHHKLRSIPSSSSARIAAPNIFRDERVGYTKYLAILRKREWWRDTELNAEVPVMGVAPVAAYERSSGAEVGSAAPKPEGVVRRAQRPPKKLLTLGTRFYSKQVELDPA